jgi:hypothetical protein
VIDNRLGCPSSRQQAKKSGGSVAFIMNKNVRFIPAQPGPKKWDVYAVHQQQLFKHF